MLDLSELWIGDLVKLRKSKRIGKFEGIRRGKAVVNIAGKVVLTSAANLMQVSDHDNGYTDTTIWNNDLVVKSVPPGPKDEIDLHIEVLNPAMQHGRPERILAIQVAAATEFLSAAASHKLPSVRIIHGKGTGVLKAEIDHLISMEPAVLNSYIINGGGGVEVLFR